MVAEIVDVPQAEQPGWQPPHSKLARPAAVYNLAEALSGRGLSDAAAGVLARSAVRPEDMRRKLAEATELRVQGGTLMIVETRLWSASVAPHPANPREYGRRRYRLGGDGMGYTDTPDPTSVAGRSAELEIRVSDPNALAQRLEDTKQRLLNENPLAHDLAVEGVLQPLTVVALTVNHANGHPTASTLITADGSSRISAAHSILGYSPSKVVYEWGGDERKHRKEVNRWIRYAQKTGWDCLVEDERERLRVLTVPARVVVGFVPDSHAGQRFHTAVRNFIGLTHIRPPRPYGSAVENNAKADAVLDSLVEATRAGNTYITDTEKRWFAATMTSSEAEAEGFSHYRDVRAASIVSSLLGGGSVTARRVNDGIRSLTAKQRPKREERVDIAVELILRGFPSECGEEDGKFLRPRRSVLQRAYRLPEIVELPASTLLEEGNRYERSLDQLRDLAFKEVECGQGNDGRLGIAQTELAVKAAYYMAFSEPMALQREVYGGGDEDARGPVAVLRAMLSSRRGVHQAYEIVRSGRQGEPLYEVDGRGIRTATSEGGYRPLTDALVRHTYTGEPLDEAVVGYPGAAKCWSSVKGTVEVLQRKVRAMESVPGQSGNGYHLKSEGWRPEEIDSLRAELDRVDRKIASWSDRWYELESLREGMEEDPG
ncbi:hypothetical protein [Streptomyces sp. NPDC096068]|uniref:hypothetical protein n=1 Tax=Streptomyces sp. NPDC096068 TaxID=3155424 RepID=UPI00331B39D4